MHQLTQLQLWLHQPTQLRLSMDLPTQLQLTLPQQLLHLLTQLLLWTIEFPPSHHQQLLHQLTPHQLTPHQLSKETLLFLQYQWAQ